MSTIKNWKNIKHELKTQFDKLEDKFFEADQQDSNDLIQELQKSYNLTKAEAEEKFYKVLEDLEENLQNIPSYIKKAGQTIEQYSHTAADKIGTLVDSCKDIGSTAKSEVEDSFSCITQYVRKNPVKSVLMAVTAGLLLNKIASN